MNGGGRKVGMWALVCLTLLGVAACASDPASTDTGVDGSAADSGTPDVAASTVCIFGVSTIGNCTLGP